MIVGYLVIFNKNQKKEGIEDVVVLCRLVAVLVALIVAMVT